MSNQYWANQPTDNPHTLNGFAGTWQISDHSLLAEPLVEYVMECFPKVERFKRIPLEDINRVLNDIWEGPGSMQRVVDRTLALRAARMQGYEGTVKMDEPPTIDDDLGAAVPDVEENE